MGDRSDDRAGQWGNRPCDSKKIRTGRATYGFVLSHCKIALDAGLEDRTQPPNVRWKKYTDLSKNYSWFEIVCVVYRMTAQTITPGQAPYADIECKQWRAFSLEPPETYRAIRILDAELGLVWKYGIVLLRYLALSFGIPKEVISLYNRYQLDITSYAFR